MHTLKIYEQQTNGVTHFLLYKKNGSFIGDFSSEMLINEKFKENNDSRRIYKGVIRG